MSSTNENNIITEEVIPSLQGVMPSIAATCSSQGIPNVTYISQVYYVDEKHVAISNQFFNKTVRNITENPFLCVIVNCPIDYIQRKLVLKFVESQNSGGIFDNMKTQLEIIAGMQGMQDVFSLRSADIFKVISIDTL